MNKTEEIIKVALQGGWRKENILNGIDLIGGLLADIQGAVLDPKFWEAIGKAKGWGSKKWIEMGVVNSSVFEYAKVLTEWEFHAIRFYHINLTQSFDDAINYLYELIK